MPEGTGSNIKPVDAVSGEVAPAPDLPPVQPPVGMPANENPTGVPVPIASSDMSGPGNVVPPNLAEQAAMDRVDVANSQVLPTVDTLNKPKGVASQEPHDLEQALANNTESSPPQPGVVPEVISAESKEPLPAPGDTVPEYLLSPDGQKEIFRIQRLLEDQAAISRQIIGIYERLKGHRKNGMHVAKPTTPSVEVTEENK